MTSAAFRARLAELLRLIAVTEEGLVVTGLAAWWERAKNQARIS